MQIHGRERQQTGAVHDENMVWNLEDDHNFIAFGVRILGIRASVIVTPAPASKGW